MTRKPGAIRATFTIIGEMYRELPRTMAILTGLVLLFGGMFVWAVIEKGWLYALAVVGVWGAIGFGSSWLSRWAAKGDGIDDK